MKIVAGFVLTFVAYASALYSSSDDVVELTDANFKSQVLESDELWLVEFYSQGCVHCQRLASDWITAASSLKGLVKIGAVDVNVHGSLSNRYDIKGLPTIKVFGFNKDQPKDYQRGRKASDIEEYAYEAVREMLEERKSGRRSSGGSKKSSGGGGGGGGGNHVITLTDDNFKELVLDSDEPWLVEFYAPWCGHCKRLEPEWKSAANQLFERTQGAVKMGALDATAHQRTAGRYGIRGYPTIKIFGKGSKDSPDDYEGGRDSSSILAKAMEMYEENVEPPTIDEITSAKVQEDNCLGKQLCVVSFLPHILDSGADGRNKILDMIAKMGDKFKKRTWGWMWTEAGKQPKLEEALGIGGSGFPAMAVVVEKKKMYTVLAGPFSEEGIEDFLNGISFGRAGRNSHGLKDEKLPEIKDCDPWDGKDGQLPEEEDIDLSDFKWDDEL